MRERRIAFIYTLLTIIVIVIALIIIKGINLPDNKNKQYNPPVFKDGKIIEGGFE